MIVVTAQPMKLRRWFGTWWTISLMPMESRGAAMRYFIPAQRTSVDECSGVTMDVPGNVPCASDHHPTSLEGRFTNRPWSTLSLPCSRTYRHLLYLHHCVHAAPGNSALTAKCANPTSVPLYTPTHAVGKIRHGLHRQDW